MTVEGFSSPSLPLFPDPHTTEKPSPVPSAQEEHPYTETQHASETLETKLRGLLSQFKNARSKASKKAALVQLLRLISNESKNLESSLERIIQEAQAKGPSGASYSTIAPHIHALQHKLREKADVLKQMEADPEKNKKKIEELSEKIHLLRSELHEKLCSASLNAAYYGIKAIHISYTTLAASAARVTQVAPAIGSVASTVSLGIAIADIKQSVGDIKKIRKEQEDLKSTIDTLQKKGADENLLRALDLKMHYQKQLKFSKIIRGLVQNTISLISSAIGIAAGILLALGAAAAVIVCPVSVVLALGYLVIAVGLYIDSEKAQIAATFKKIPWKIKEATLNKAIKGIYKETEKKLHSSHPQLSTSKEFITRSQQLLKKSASHLRKINQVHTEAVEKLDHLDKQLLSLQKQHLTEKAEELKKSRFAQHKKVEAIKAQLDRAIIEHNEKAISIFDAENTAEAQLLDFIQKQTKKLTYLQSAKKTIAAQILLLDQKTKHMHLANTLGVSLDQLKEIQFSLWKALQDTHSYEAFASHIRTHAPSIEADFKKNPVDAIFRYIIE